MSSLLTIQQSVAGSVATIRLAGKMQSLDLPLVNRIFDQVEEHDVACIEVDLSRLDHMDSGSLGFFAARYKHLLDRKIDLRLTRVHPSVRKLLRLTNLDRVLIIEESDAQTGLPSLKQRQHLWESYEYAQSIMSGLGKGLLGLDCDGRIIYTNPTAEQMLGKTDAELYEKPFADLICGGEDRDAWFESRLAAMPQRRCWLQLRRGDREMFEAVVFATHVRHSNEPVGTLVGITDSLELERTREALHAAQRRLKLIAACTSDALLMYDTERRFTFANPAAERLTGYSPFRLEAMEWTALAAPRHRELWERAWANVFAGREVRNEELLLRTGQGQERWCSLSGVPVAEETGGRVGLLFSLRDIHERYQITQRLRALESMEAVGRLAGGLARDFSQVLSRERDQLAALEERMGADHPAHAQIAELLQQNGYMRQLIEQLQTGQKGSDRTRRRIDVAEVARQVLGQLKARIVENIHVRTEFPSDASEALMTPGDLNEALLHVCINAIEAMEDGGSLTLSSRRARMEPVGEERVGSRPAGDFVCLSVTDTGKGIPSDVRKRVFEPFFTTKTIGLGIGTGLSIVY